MCGHVELKLTGFNDGSVDKASGSPFNESRGQASGETGPEQRNGLQIYTTVYTRDSYQPGTSQKSSYGKRVEREDTRL